MLSVATATAYTVYDALSAEGFATAKGCETYRLHPQILPLIVPSAFVNYIIFVAVR